MEDLGPLSSSLMIRRFTKAARRIATTKNKHGKLVVFNQPSIRFQACGGRVGWWRDGHG
jgi:hypothetical protein